MAPRYRTYQRQVGLNQPIEVPPNIDQAAMRETGKMYGELAQRAQQVQNFAFKRAEQTAISEGTAAGSQNPEQVLEQYGGERPTDIYGQAAFDAASKIGGVQVEAKAREAIGNAYIEAKKTKQDPNDFQAGLIAIIGGYTSALKDMDPLTAARTQAKLESYARSAFLDRSADAIKEQQKILDGDATSITDSMLEHAGLMGQVATRGGDQEFKAAMVNYKDSMESLGQTPKSIQTYIAKAKNRYHEARIRREFRDAKDKGAFLNKFREDRKTGKGLARGIDDLRIEILTNAFDTDIRQADALRTAEIKDLNREINGRLGILGDGGHIGDADLDELRKKAGDLGDPALVQRVDFLARENAELGTIGQGGSAAYREAADRAAKQIQSFVNANKTTPEYLVKKEKRLRKAAEATRKREIKDPLAALHKAQRLDTPVALSKADMADPAKLKDHITANKNASLFYNVDTVYLSQESIDQLKSVFSKSNPDIAAQAVLVESITQAAGRDAPKVFAQIATQTDATDLALIGSLMNKRMAAEYFEGRRAIASGAKVNLGATQTTALRDDITGIVGQSLREKPGLVGDIEQTARAIYISRHGNEEYDKKKLENIVHEVVGGSDKGKNAVGGIIEYDDDRIILPRNHVRDEDAFEATIASITDDDLNALDQTHGTPVYENKLTGELKPITASMIPGLKLESYGSGLYTLRDSRGNLVASRIRRFDDDGIELPPDISPIPYVLDINALQEIEVADPEPMPTSFDVRSPEEYPDQSIQPDMTEETPDQSIQPDMTEEYPDQSIEPDMTEEYPDQSIQSDMPEEFPDQNITPSTAIKRKLSTQEMQQVQTANAKGRPVVDSAVRAVDAVFGGGLFLTRIARVESDFGNNPETFRRISKGIWQVDPIGFKETRRNTNKLRKARAKIKSEFGIDYMQLNHVDLQKPLYGAIAARLFLLSRARGPLPTTLEGQAKLWKRIYNTAKGDGTVEQFINNNRGT
tara:strand:+ start:59 stop:3007 length:2949 start_codon:yes stop_codon:yes gene_type:complete